jgi:hypothetical protein
MAAQPARRSKTCSDGQDAKIDARPARSTHGRLRRRRSAAADALGDRESPLSSCRHARTRYPSVKGRPRTPPSLSACRAHRLDPGVRINALRALATYPEIPRRETRSPARRRPLECAGPGRASAWQCRGQRCRSRAGWSCPTVVGGAVTRRLALARQDTATFARLADSGPSHRLAAAGGGGEWFRSLQPGPRRGARGGGTAVTAAALRAGAGAPAAVPSSCRRDGDGCQTRTGPFGASQPASSGPPVTHPMSRDWWTRFASPPAIHSLRR